MATTVFPRTVRISVTDADATDSSSDEEGSSVRRRVKRFTKYVNLKPHSTPTSPESPSDDAVLDTHLPLKKRKRNQIRRRTTSFSATLGTDAEQANGRQISEPVLKPELLKSPEKEKSATSGDVCPSESFNESFNSMFSTDLFTCDMISPFVPDFDLLTDLGSDLCGVRSFVFDAYSDSCSDDFGFGISGITWPTEEQSLDIGEIFGSDHVVAI